MSGENEEREAVLVISLFVMLCTLTVFLILLCASCTLSFSNIDTHGKSDDLIDETLTNQPDIKPTLSIPATSL